MNDVYIIIEELFNDYDSREVWGIFKTKQDALESIKQIYDTLCDEAKEINKKNPHYHELHDCANVGLIENGEGISYNVWVLNTKYFIRRVHFGEHFDIWQL